MAITGECKTDKINYEDEIQQVLAEMAAIEKKAQALVNRFYVEHKKADVYSIIDLIYTRGNPKNREFLDKFKEKFDGGDLTLMEISRYNDLYDQHKQMLLEEEE